MNTSNLVSALSGLASALILVACATNTESIVGSETSTYLKKPIAAPAHPAVSYMTSSGAIAVMDSDGTHQTTVYTPSSGWTVQLGATWSPSGSLVWTERNADWSDGRIRAIDIGVNSSGVPVGTNLRTILESTSIDFMRVKWSATSTVNRIAFAFTDDDQITYLCTVSASGGTWDTLHAEVSNPNNSIGDMAWSPDDSKIAWVVGHSTGLAAVVVSTSSGSTTDSVQMGSATGMNIDWSRGSSSVNKIAYRAGNSLYYVTPTTGSTPTTNGLSCISGPTWSPSNGSVMYIQQERNGSYSLMKATALTSTTTTLVRNWSNSWGYIDWR